MGSQTSGGAGHQGLVALLVMILVLCFIVAYCCWGACCRIFCRRRCPGFEGEDAEGGWGSEAGAAAFWPGVDPESQLSRSAFGISQPTIILLPYGRMVVVDSSVFERLQADSGVDLVELGEASVRDLPALPAAPPSSPPQSEGNTTPVDSEGTKGSMASLAPVFPPPSYDSIYGLADLPPSYDEILRQLRAEEIMLREIREDRYWEEEESRRVEEEEEEQVSVEDSAVGQGEAAGEGLVTLAEEEEVDDEDEESSGEEESLGYIEEEVCQSQIRESRV
ncbi:claspin-like [Hetaerina americana]|uniref:claspin-like n=1 Tax=Hetaerina americana TaxID=62018 RepID=UPI003A7F4EA2